MTDNLKIRSVRLTWSCCWAPGLGLSLKIGLEVSLFQLLFMDEDDPPAAADPADPPDTAAVAKPADPPAADPDVAKPADPLDCSPITCFKTCTSSQHPIVAYI